MNFTNELGVVEDGKAENPYGSKVGSDWESGLIDPKWLNDNFGHLETAEEMKNATESEGLKLYFDWLKQQGILP